MRSHPINYTSVWMLGCATANSRAPAAGSKHCRSSSELDECSIRLRSIDCKIQYKHARKQARRAAMRGWRHAVRPNNQNATDKRTAYILTTGKVLLAKR